MFETGGELKTRRLEVWSEFFRGEGLAVDVADLARAHDVAFEAYVAAWEQNEQFRVEDAAGQMATTLGGVERDVAVEILTSGFSEAGRRARVQLCEGVDQVLKELSQRDVKLAIICDIGLTPSDVLREHLDVAGLLDVFAITVFSDEVGWYKPAREIFAYTLDAIGGTPRRAAHVGDRKRTDVQGAREYGMTSVRYTGVYDDPAVLDDADFVIEHHRSLLGVLELV